MRKYSREYIEDIGVKILGVACILYFITALCAEFFQFPFLWWGQDGFVSLAEYIDADNGWY